MTMNGTGTVNVSALYKKRGWHIIFPVFLVSVVAFLDRVNIAYAGMTMTQTLDWLSPEIFGAGAGMFFIGYFFFEIPGSLVAARFDACRWIARIMFSWGLVCGLMAFMQSPFQFYLFRFLLGACEASLYPVIYAVLFLRWFMADELAKATSLMLTSLLIAAIIGAPLAGVLLEMQLFGLLGWQSLFLLEAVPALLLTFVFYFGIPDRPEKAKWLTEDERRYLVDTFAEETQRKNRAKSYSVWQAFTDKKVWLLCVIYFGQALGFWGFNFWMPQVLKGLSGWSPSMVGGIIAIPMTIALVFQIFWGIHSSKTREKRWHVAGCMFLAAFGLAAAPFFTNPFISLGLITLTCIGVYGQLGIWWTVPTTFLSGAAAAGASAMINSIANLGGYVGPYMLGVVKTNTGTYDLGYFILAGSLACSGLLMLTLKKTTAPQTEDIPDASSEEAG